MLTILSLLLLLPYGYGHKSDEQLKTIAEQAYGIHLEPVPSGAFKEYVVLAAQNDDKFGRNIFCKQKAGSSLCNHSVNRGSYINKEDARVFYPYFEKNKVERVFEVLWTRRIAIWSFNQTTVCNEVNENKEPKVGKYERHMAYTIHGKYHAFSPSQVTNIEGAVEYCKKYPNVPDFEVEHPEVDTLPITNKINDYKEMLGLCTDDTKGTCYEDFDTKEILRLPPGSKKSRGYPIYNRGNITLYSFCCLLFYQQGDCSGTDRCLYLIYDHLTGKDYYIPDNVEGFMPSDKRVLALFPIMGDNEPFYTTARKNFKPTTPPPSTEVPNTEAPGNGTKTD